MARPTNKSAKTTKPAAAAACPKKAGQRRDGRKGDDFGGVGSLICGHSVSRQERGPACPIGRPSVARRELTPVNAPHCPIYGFQIILYWPHQGLKSLA